MTEVSSAKAPRMRIAIIGSGYVGLVSGTCLAHLGHQIICVDVDPERVRTIENATPPFYEPGLSDLLKKVLADGRLTVSTSVVRSVAASDMTVLAVGTPCRDGDIDLSFVRQAATEVGQGLRDSPAYHVVVVKSTVVPGTTDGVVRSIVQEASRRTSAEFGLCMNPEFLREGSAVSDFLEPDRIVIGQSDERAGQPLAEVYKSFNCPKIFTTLQNAEMIKYASNSLLATLISFSNEIASLCEATPYTNVEEVLDGVHLDRRLSPVLDGRRISPGILTYLRAGCGFGGSCLPKDVAALRAFGRKRGVRPHLLDAVLTVNSDRPSKLVSLAESAVGSLRAVTVAVLGIAFKPGTDDLRDSPALALIEVLESKGARVRAYDPFVASLPRRDVTVCTSVEEALCGCEVAIVASALPELAILDWDSLSMVMRSPFVIDGRNALRSVQFPDNVKYLPIGQHAEGAISK